MSSPSLRLTFPFGRQSVIHRGAETVAGLREDPSPHIEPQGQEMPMRCTSVMVDRLDWTSEQHRAAAAVLGSEARDMVLFIRNMSRAGADSEYLRGALSDAAMTAVCLARQAAHYARWAMDGDSVSHG